MAEKTLKFQFALDQTTFSQVQRAMEALTKQAAEFKKQSSGFFGGATSPGSSGVVPGGGTPNRSQQPNMTKVILENANAFKSMASMSAQSMRGLTDALRTSFTEQTTRVENLQKALKNLSNTYASVGSQGKNAAAIQAKMIQIAGQIQSGQGNLAQIQGLYPTQLPGVPGPGNPGGGGPGGPKGPGGGAGGFGNPIGLGGVGPTSVAQALLGNGAGAVLARSLGLLVTGATGVMGTSQAFNNMMMDTRVSRGQAIRPAWDRMRRGDISDALAERHLSKMSRDEQIEAMRSVFSPEETMRRVTSAAGTTIKTLGRGAAALTPDQLQTAAYGDYQKLLDNVKQRSDYFTDIGRGYDYLNETRGSRIAGSRMLGMGVNKNAKGEWVDSYTARANDLYMRGYSTEERAGAQAQAQNMGGRRFANAFGDAMMGASGAGYDVGGLLSGAARSGGLAGARGLARGALGGGIDTAAGIQLGQSLFGFDPRGTVTGAGALQAVQQGFNFTGGPEDFNMVQRAQMGMQSADALAKGFSPYQQGMNIVSAIGAMPGASTYAQDALGGRMGFKELTEIIGGKTSARSRAYGIGAKEAQAQLGGMAHGLFSPYVEQGGTDNVSNAMRAMRASGKGEQEYMVGLGAQAKGQGKLASDARSQLEALGVLASDMMGGDTEGGLGMVQLLSGVKDLGKKGGIAHGNMPYGGIDQAEQEQRKTEVEQRKKDADAMRNAMGDIVDLLRKNKERIAGTESFGNFAIQLDVLTEKFAKLAGITDEVIKKGEGSTTKEATKPMRAAMLTSEFKAGARAMGLGMLVDSPAWNLLK